MPRVTPSLIVDFIDASFPELRDRGAIGNLDAGSLQVVGILVALLDRLDESVLTGLSREEYRDVVISAEHLRTTLNRWHGPPPPGRGPYTIGAFLPLGNRHPVAVLRDVMHAAPEEP